MCGVTFAEFLSVFSFSTKPTFGRAWCSWLGTFFGDPRSNNLIGLSKQFRRLTIFTFGIWLSVMPVHAVTRNALSPSYTDVNNAVASAASGDTVNVPAGTATWSSTLAIGTKAISLIGAGAGSTVITTQRPGRLFL